MVESSVCVATFNCEWRKTRSADAAVIRQRVLDGNADVVCLTEAYADFFEGFGHTIEACAHRHDAVFNLRRKVLLWSKNPWTDVSTRPLSGLPEGRFVCGRTETPIGQIMFFGVCIPYRFAGVRHATDRKTPWEVHFEYLSALEGIIGATPRGLVLLGDFNQRIPRKYQPHKAFEALQHLILTSMEIASAGIIEPIGRQAIDHVCHSPDLALHDLVGVSNISDSGREISDHFGVRVRLRQNDVS